MAVQILLIEDDESLGRTIVAKLRKAGYELDWWREGRRLAAGEELGVQLVILDIMLPGAYGLDVLRDIRAGSDVPVLVLSARSDARDKVRALELGADDYMTKPFWPDELLERVKARLRRPTIDRGGSSRIVVGALELDTGSRRLLVDGREVSLTPTEFDLVLALARQPGTAVTRAALARNVLHEDDDAAIRSLDAHVSRLRKKLGEPKLVETIWGVGYRLAPRTSE